jgi:hypothetical protein
MGNLPPPHHVLKAAVAALRSAGWAEADACQLVIDTADMMLRRTPSGVSSDWVYQVQAQAKTRLARLGRAGWLHERLTDAIRTGQRPNVHHASVSWAIEEPAPGLLRITARWADGDAMQAERAYTPAVTT